MADQAALTIPLIPETQNDLASPEPTSPAFSPAPKKAKKKANLSLAERDKKCEPIPKRSPCKAYVKGEAGEWEDNNNTIEGVKSRDFQVSNNKRVASRSGFLKTLALDALRLKTACNDEVTVIIKQWATDRNDRTVFSTSREENIPSAIPIHFPCPISNCFSQCQRSPTLFSIQAEAIKKNGSRIQRATTKTERPILQKVRYTIQAE